MICSKFLSTWQFQQFQVDCYVSETSFHFCKDCRIFCEGGKEAIINAINRNNLPLLAFGLSMAFGRNLAFGLNLAIGLNMAFSLNNSV
jgi:hypothetical protein